MSGGFFLMKRGWMDHPNLATSEPFTRREAWVWLIEKAAYSETRQRIGKDMIVVGRGQISTSYRILGKAWNRPIAWVQRFMRRLEIDKAIDTVLDTGRLLITLCNYEEHQSPKTVPDTQTNTQSDTAVIRGRYTGDTQKKEGKEESIQDSPKNPGVARDLFGEPKAETLKPKPRRASPDPDRKPTVKALLYAEGSAKLSAMTGETAEGASRLIGMWLKAGNEPLAVFKAIQGAYAKWLALPDDSVDATKPFSAVGYVRAALGPRQSVPTPTAPRPASINGWNVEAVVDHCGTLLAAVCENCWPGFTEMIVQALNRGVDAHDVIYPVMRDIAQRGIVYPDGSPKIKSPGFFAKAIADKMARRDVA